METTLNWLVLFGCLFVFLLVFVCLCLFVLVVFPSVFYNMYSQPRAH